jgi:hypothetical protein
MYLFLNKVSSMYSHSVILMVGISLIYCIDKVLCECEIMRYMPGNGFNFVERWVVLTEKAVRVYKSKVTANSFPYKPVLLIKFDKFCTLKRYGTFVII